MIYGNDMTSARRAELGASHLEFRAAPNIFSFLSFFGSRDGLRRKERAALSLSNDWHKSFVCIFS